MSDSDSNDTVIPDNVVFLSSVVRTLSRMLNAEVNKDTEIPHKSKGHDT